VETATDVAVPTRELTPLDRRMKRLLRLPVDGPSGSATSARKVFEVSIWISATRCLLTYVILPFVFPIIGVSANDHAIGLPVSVVAVIADVASIRRFWRADHKYRWHYTALAGAIICAMLVLITGDLLDLLR
jgi:ABC-type iron transport system FetAB permease component